MSLLFIDNMTSLSVYEDTDRRPMTLLCPICQSENVHVVDTRPDDDDGIIRRRRCENRHIFYTTEIVCVEAQPRKLINITKARELRKQGLLHKQIADRLGFSTTSIGQALRRNK